MRSVSWLRSAPDRRRADSAARNGRPGFARRSALWKGGCWRGTLALSLCLWSCPQAEMGPIGTSAEPRYDPQKHSLLWADGFESYASDADLLAAYVTNPESIGRIYVESGAGLGGGRAIRFDWPASSALTLSECRDDGIVLEKAFADAGSAPSELYLSFWVRYEPGFVWDWDAREPCRGDAKKIWFFWEATGGPRWILVMESQNELRTGFDGVQDPLLTQNLGSRVTRETIADGEWHRFTFHIRQGSETDARDGFIRGWIDGRLRWEYFGLASGSSGGFYLFKAPATFNHGSPVEQSEWMDSITIWTR